MADIYELFDSLSLAEPDDNDLWISSSSPLNYLISPSLLSHSINNSSNHQADRRQHQDFEEFELAPSTASHHHPLHLPWDDTLDLDSSPSSPLPPPPLPPFFYLDPDDFQPSDPAAVDCLPAFHIHHTLDSESDAGEPVVAGGLLLGLDDDSDWENVRVAHDQDDEEEEEALRSIDWDLLVTIEELDRTLSAYQDDASDYENIVDGYEISAGGKAPAARSVVENLPSVAITEEDAVRGATMCAVCKEEVRVGEEATQLPCTHCYHGGCILPWLEIANTCPVCRYELPIEGLRLS